jgi:hypothetical protein
MNVNPNPSPFGGLAPNLIPNPPADMPEAPGAGDAMVSLSPFSKPQDVDSIIASLTLDRPLTLYIPNREKYPNYQFRIINDTPQEMAEAQRKGWMPVDDQELIKLFQDKVSGIDKTGKITRPLLMARSKQIGEIVAKRYRQMLHDLYQGMDPAKKQFNSKYVNIKPTVSSGDTAGAFSFAKIKV